MSDSVSCADLLGLSYHGPWAVVTGGSERVDAAFARLLADVGIDLVDGIRG